VMAWSCCLVATLLQNQVDSHQVGPLLKTVSVSGRNSLWLCSTSPAAEDVKMQEVIVNVEKVQKEIKIAQLLIQPISSSGASVK
jgi:hypothetical protein